MILTKIATFIKSLCFHIWLGFPKTTQKEINHRYNICVGCSEYDTINQECKQCGCFINNRSIFFNKLAWADQGCPLNKWYPIIRK